MLPCWAGGCGTIVPAPDPDVRYIAFGDSTTNGPAATQYHEYLADLLDEPASAFANEGMSGERTSEGLSRLRDIFEQGRYPEATTLLYWEGGKELNEFIQENDPLLQSSPSDPDFPHDTELSAALDEVQANVEDAVLEARFQGLTVFVATYYPLAPEVEVCEPLPFNVLLPEQAERGNAYLSELNATLEFAALRSGATVIDVAAIGEELKQDSANYANCNHLSAQGNQRVAEVFAGAIGTR